jgi:hypothetical protein
MNTSCRECVHYPVTLTKKPCVNCEKGDRFEAKNPPKTYADGIAQGRREAADIFEWLLGYTDFRQREQGEGAYWWRKELRNRIDEAGIILGTASDEKTEKGEI